MNTTQTLLPASRLRPGLGAVLILIAAVLWSTSALLASAPQLNQLPQESRSGIVAFWRAIFALVLLLPMVRRPRFRWAMVPMVACFVAMNWTFLTALMAGPPANAIWLQNMAPAWVMLAGVLWFGEQPLSKDWVMLACCSVGVGLILVMQLTQPASGAWWAPWLAILSGLSYAGVILCLRKLRNEDSAWLIALNHLVTALAMAPLAFGHANSIPQGNIWWVLIAFGVLQMGLPYLLFARGLKSTPSHVASLITLLEPVLLPVWLFLVWHGHASYQPPDWWTIVGGTLILTGLLYRFIGLRPHAGLTLAHNKRSTL